MIPSSSVKPPPAVSRFGRDGYEAYEEVEEDTLVPATGRRQRTVRYEITPSKTTAAREMSPLQEDDAEEEIVQDAAQTPSKPSRSSHSWETPSRGVVFTPTKQTVTSATSSKPLRQPALFASTPVKQVQQAKDHGSVTKTAANSTRERQGESLYDALGWNDDFSD